MKTRRSVTAAVAALAACGVLGMTSAGAQASPAAAAWTRQHPPAHPPAVSGAAMAYDAATGTAVLFGGDYDRIGYGITFVADTWTWG